MEGRMGFGDKTEEVIRGVTQTIKQLTKDQSAQCFISPRIAEEIRGFFEDPHQQFLKDFLGSVTIKSPDLNTIQFPATVFAQYVEENRTRAYRGMTVAEEEIQKAGNMFMGKEILGKKEFQMTVGTIIKGFRERFRNATRVGYIDSLGDLDLIMLAKEQNGSVVTTDEGLLRWARICGVKEIPASVWGEKIRQMCLK